jgi:hypothetical protein
MKLKRLPMKMLTIFATFSCLAGCGLSVTPTKLDVPARKAYMRPTDSHEPKRDLDLTKEDEFMVLHKWTCFSPDDIAVIKRKLNECK